MCAPPSRQVPTIHAHTKMFVSSRFHYVPSAKGAVSHFTRTPHRSPK